MISIYKVPGSEITEQLKNVLQKRLNSRTLDEIQNALLKNPHIRLEPSDIRFIQHDPEIPSKLIYFTVHSIARNYLTAFKYYMNQQLLTFCISPKYREQSTSGAISYHRCQSRSIALPSHGRRSRDSIVENIRKIETPYEHSVQPLQLPQNFIPYQVPDFPPDPDNYSPNFYLCNKPPGTGQRDTGIACIEARLINFDGTLIENNKTLPGGVESCAFFQPFLANIAFGEDSEEFEFTKITDHMIETPDTCALIQFTIWQNGNVGIEELIMRLKISVHQAICDIVTEYGLLSLKIFEKRPILRANSLSIFSIQHSAEHDTFSHQETFPSFLSTTNALPLTPTTPKCFSGALVFEPTTTTTQRHQFQRVSSATLRIDENDRQRNDSAKFKATRTIASRFYSGAHPSSTSDTTPELGEFLRSDFISYADKWLSKVANESREFQGMKGLGILDRNTSVRMCQFYLDGDFAAKNMTLPLYELLKQLMRGEKILICGPKGSYNNFSTQLVSSPFAHRRLQVLNASGSHWSKIVGSIEKDYGHISPVETDLSDLVLIGFNEQLTNDALHNCQSFEQQHNSSNDTSKISEQTTKPSSIQGESKILYDHEEHIWRNTQEPYSRRMSCVSSLGFWRSNTLFGGRKCLDQQLHTTEERNGNLGKFSPCISPFIPRQRLFYAIIKDESITTFFYNYSNEVVSKAREIIERLVFWYNARSRLLREIALHKMGITHLSSQKTPDFKFNAYLSLIWTNPSVLIRNDFPIDSLTAPGANFTTILDWDKMPRIYSQLLLRLYRFLDHAFIPRNLSADPFEEQTEQMLMLWDFVRSTLNDHQLFHSIHQRLLTNKDNAHTTTTINDEHLKRIIYKSHEVHYVKTPILLFPSWRRKVGLIRVGKVLDNDLIQRHNNLSHRTVNDDPCAFKVHHILFDDYVKYLNTLGLKLLRIEKPNVCEHKHEQHHVSRDGNRHGSKQSTTHSSIFYPQDVWLFMAMEAGILFISLSIAEPYFSVRILQWNISNLDITHNRQKESTNKENQRNLRQLENAKNEIVKNCHVHSFAYDFHLRMISQNIISSKQAPSYNPNTFFIDFLQYYACRPPHARNCLYEDAFECEKLEVKSQHIWEYFINNERLFKWNVLHLKNFDQKDEFMLLSREKCQLFNQKYELVTIVFNNAELDTLNEKRIALKFYTILVASDNINPLSETLECPSFSSASSPDVCGFEGGIFTKVPNVGVFTKVPVVIPQQRLLTNEVALANEATCLNTEYINSLTGQEPDEDIQTVNTDTTDITRASSAHQSQASDGAIQIREECNAFGAKPPRHIFSNQEFTPHYTDSTNAGGRRRFCSGGIIASSSKGLARGISGRMSLPPNSRTKQRMKSESPFSSTESFTHNIHHLQRPKLPYILSSANVITGLIDEWNSSASTATIGPSNYELLFESVVKQELEHRSSLQRLAIQKNHPIIRRHRHAQNSYVTASGQHSHKCDLTRENGPLLIPEQAVYIHYLNGNQRRLQHVLEKSVAGRKEDLAARISTADKLVHVDQLWKSLLSFKPVHSKRHLSFFPGSSSRFDAAVESVISLKSLAPSEMSCSALEELLKVVSVCQINKPGDKLSDLLKGVNYVDLFRFLIHFFENGSRCRFFELPQYTYLIITNNSFLDSAIMLRRDNSTENIQLFALFKDFNQNFNEENPSDKASYETKKHFNEVLACISSYTWTKLLLNPSILNS